MDGLKWLRTLVVLVLLAVCVTTGWYCVSTQQIRAKRQQLEIALDTSRGRERKQQREYAQVVQELPEAEAMLAQVQPMADEAVAREKELRARRKALRAEKAQLEAALASVQALNEQLEQAVWSTQYIQSLIPQE